MDREQLVIKIWSFATIMICSFYVCQLFFNFIEELRIGNMEITFDSGGLVQIIIMTSTYYITKLILRNEK